MLIGLINVLVLEVLEKQLSPSPVWSVPSQLSRDGCSCMMPHGQLYDFTDLPSCVPNMVVQSIKLFILCAPHPRWCGWGRGMGGVDEGRERGGVDEGRERGGVDDEGQGMGGVCACAPTEWIALTSQ